MYFKVRSLFYCCYNTQKKTLLEMAAFFFIYRYR